MRDPSSGQGHDVRPPQASPPPCNRHSHQELPFICPSPPRRVALRPQHHSSMAGRPSPIHGSPSHHRPVHPLTSPNSSLHLHHLPKAQLHPRQCDPRSPPSLPLPHLFTRSSSRAATPLQWPSNPTALASTTASPAQLQHSTVASTLRLTKASTTILARAGHKFRPRHTPEPPPAAPAL